MANSAFDNLFVTPAPLPTGNAGMSSAGGDRRDFDDALKRAYQPAPADQIAGDALRRSDHRNSLGDASSDDNARASRESNADRPSGSGDSRSNSTNHADRTDESRRQRDSDQSASPAPTAKVSATSRRKAKPADKKESSTKRTPATPAELNANQAERADSATNGTNTSAPAVPVGAIEVGDAKVTASAGEKIQGVANQSSDTDQPATGGESTSATGGESETAKATTGGTMVALVTQDRADLSQAAAQPKSADAKITTASRPGNNRQALSQSIESADDHTPTGEAVSAAQQSEAAQQVPAAGRNSLKESTRALKLQGRAARTSDDGQAATTQINLAIAALPGSISAEAPHDSNSTATSSIALEAAKPTDDNADGSPSAAANQPAALTGNSFASTLHEPTANMPGQLALNGTNEKTPAAGQVRGLNQVDQARFVQRVAKAFRAADDQGGQIRIRLSPPELGSLKLEVSLRNGVMTAKLETETNSARSLLLDNLPALRQRLADQNIKIERFDVDLRQDGRGDGSPNPPPDFSGSRHNSPRSPNPARIGTVPGKQAEPAIAKAGTGLMTGESRINVII